jgi:peptidoglycan/LPS O-acetylase OafA/YrhL
LAALLVAYSHVRQALLVDYPQIPHPHLAAKGLYWLASYGHAGVIVFFVLSGFLVGGKALDLAASKHLDQDWPKFLADRFARIFIVLLPALLLSLLIFWALILLVPSAPFVSQPMWGWDMQAPLNADRSPLLWMSAATLLNEFLTPTLRINAPLWSLAYEWFYYMMILAAIFVYRRVWSKAACIVIFYAIALLAISLIRSTAIAESGLIWLFGLASRVIFNQGLLRGKWLCVPALVTVFVILMATRFCHVPDYALGVGIAFLIAIADWSHWHGGAKLGEALASFSYSLYVVHFPVLLGTMGILFAAGDLTARLPFQTFSIFITAFTLMATILFAKIFAMATENKTRLLRNFLLRHLQGTNSRITEVADWRR